MMTRNRTLCARASASAIVAALALAPIHAAVPKPIVDLSKSPAISGEKAPPPVRQTPKKAMVGPFDERTAELGGGAIALVVLGAGAFALARRKTRRDYESHEEGAVDDPHDPLFDEPMFQPEPTATETSAFAWGDASRSEKEGCDNQRLRESWVQRAYRGPTPDNPSLSLKARLKRAAFFERREREAAAGEAARVDADAGLPEAITDDRGHEAA